MFAGLSWYWILIIQIYRVVIAPHPFENCTYGRDECPNKQISFWLFKNETQAAPLALDLLHLNKSDFEPKLPLKVLVHGYTGHRDFSPNPEIRPVMLETQPTYVISVDYGELARRPCYYPWAVSNAHIVAKCLALLLDNFIEADIYQSEDMHLIGFSLGGQIVGLTANYVKNRLRRITSLDPASPKFRTNKLEERIDSTDADFVDVIHTDPFLFSSLPTYGHVDFYPNLEHLRQPGCRNTLFYNCNHYRAPLYYAESITSKLGFWSYSCDNWLTFMLQRCHHYSPHKSLENMGYWVSKNATGSYFLTTNSKAPFARGPLVDVQLEVIEKSYRKIDGCLQ